MDRYNSAKLFFAALGISISVIFAQIATEWIKSKGLDNWLAAISAILIVLSVGKILEIVFNELFERIRWMRKLWLGDQFVEGIWFEVVFKDNVPSYYGLLTIRSDRSGVRIGGQGYDSDGSKLEFFQSNDVSISWPMLTYTYTAHRRSTANPINSGVENIIFEERDSAPPIRLTAVFTDIFTGDSHETEAWKVTDAEICDMISLPASRREAVRRLIGEFFPDHAHIAQGRHSQADASVTPMFSPKK